MHHTWFGRVICAQQVGIDPVRRVRLRRPGPLEDRLQAQEPHQAPDSLTADPGALAQQPARHLPRAVEGRLQKLLIDAPHQPQIQRALARALVVERRAGDREQATLACDAERGLVGIDHRFPPAVAQRPKDLGQKIPLDHELAHLRSQLFDLDLSRGPPGTRACLRSSPARVRVPSSSSSRSDSGERRTERPARPSLPLRGEPPARLSPSAQPGSSVSFGTFQTPSLWSGSHLSNLSEIRGPPLTSSATDSIEPRPGNGAATAASGADRRSRRRKAPPTTVSSTVERRSTRSSRCASRGSVCRRSPGSNGWPGTPSPAGSSGLPRCVADLATAGQPALSPQSCTADEIRSFTGGRPGRRGYLRLSRSGRVSGRRPSSDDAATRTPWRSFATSRRA